MKHSGDRPEAAAASVDVLVNGRVGAEGFASTVSLIRDDAVVAIVDPGMVRDRREILDPLSSRGIDPTEVTDVLLTHHHWAITTVTPGLTVPPTASSLLHRFI